MSRTQIVIVKPIASEVIILRFRRSSPYCTPEHRLSTALVNCPVLFPALHHLGCYRVTLSPGRFFSIYQVFRIVTECFDTEYLVPLLLPHVNDVTLPEH
jgi:hypothetical protein